VAKQFEEVAEIISENDYQTDLEKEVEYYYSIAEKPSFISTKRYTADIHPSSFKDKREESEYWIEQIRRMRQGYDGLSAKGYGWIQFAKMRDPEKGKIGPEFRVRQEEFFRKVTDLQANPGRGLVGFKRRRFGFSNMGAWDVYHDCAYSGRDFFQVGMNSKGEADSRRLFNFIKFIHQNVPAQLRPLTSVSDRRDYMEFAYWWDKDKQKVVSQKGMNCEKRGTQSWILSTSSVPQSHEGNAYSKLLVDEAGKQVDLLELWAFAEDCLVINTRRVSPAIIMGTVGDITKDGKGLRELYLNNEAYALDRFCVYGYHGLIVDEFGNDMLKEAIRFIIYKRHKLKSASRKIIEAFRQKYPLCENDAFSQISEGGVGNIHLINEQIVRILTNPPEVRTGWMRAKPEGGPDFVPNTEGKIIVYELPDKHRVNGYVAGADPADSDEKKKKAGNDVSDLALAILAKPIGLEAPKLVLEYVDRPEKLDVFFEQSAMALQWYNNTRALVEDNRARMINYFKTHYPHLLPLVPASILTAKGGYEMKNSITMTEGRKQQIIGLTEDHIDHYSAFIPSVKFLEQCKVFGDSHADDDLAMAYFLALVMLQADKKAVQLVSDLTNNLPKHRLERINGQLRLITPQSVNVPRKIPKTPFSR
jgi:hypothetical protein